MKTTSPALRSHMDSTVTSLTTLWRIDRVDGKQFYFTDHDVDISFDDGDGLATYTSEGGYSRTAMVNSVGLSVDNMDMDGFLSSVYVSEVELKAGLFDYATIRVGMVNWDDLSQGQLKLRKGHIGEVLLSHGGKYTAEIRGLSSELSQTVVDQYQPECRTDLGSVACSVPVNPATLGRSAAVVVGDVFRIVTKSTTGIDWPGVVRNPDFEQGSAGVSVVVPGWTIRSGNWDITGTVDGLSPQSGSLFLRGGSTSGSMSQDIDLTLIGISLSAIDAGSVTSDFSIRRANTDMGDTGQVILTFLDTDGATLSTMYDTTDEEISPVDTWVERSVTAVAVPSGTRKIRISLSHTVSGSGSSSFDNCVMSLADTVSVNSSQDIYENRIYEVTIAGTTNVTQPVYNTTVDATTVDGTATLKAVQSWTRDAYISDVVDFSDLLIAVDDARAVAGWFSVGVVQFESGKNAGVAQELKDWDGASGGGSLFLPTPFDIIPGTKILMWPGCDKRATTCNGKFNNIINFRGEPFVPGEDLLARFSSIV